MSFDNKYLFFRSQRGHIKTSTESFFIQPVEQYTVENPNILHKITRERKIIDHPLSDDIFQGSQCDTCKDKGESFDDGRVNMLFSYFNIH